MAPDEKNARIGQEKAKKKPLITAKVHLGLMTVTVFYLITSFSPQTQPGEIHSLGCSKTR